MALPSGPTVLPFKSQRVSFYLSYKAESAPSSQVELACVCFGRDAQVLDFIQFNRRAALNSALKHSACSYLPPKDAVPDADEAIHMYPFELSPQCEVMLLLASAPCSPLLRNDLSVTRRLRFRVHAQELGGQALQLLDTDLAPLLDQAPSKAHGAAGAEPGRLGSGHQSMVIGGVYTTPQGWTLSFDCSTFPEDHWGLLLPQLRALLTRWPSLAAASAAAAATPQQRRQVVVSSRRGSDSTLAELAAALARREAATASVSAAAARGTPPTPAAGQEAAAADAEAVAAPGADEQGAGGSAQAAGMAGPTAAAGAGAPPGSPERLVLDVGWEAYRPRAAPGDEDEGGEEEEDSEPPVVDFALSLYNLQGDELATLNIDNPQFDGVIIEEPGEEEEEEEQAVEQDDGDEAQKAQQPDAAAVAEGQEQPPLEQEQPPLEQEPGAGAEREGSTPAGGDEDDDGFVKEDDSGGDDELKEESPEARAARIAAAAEAAAAAAQTAAANQRPLAERFPLKHRIQLSLPELPPDARAMVLTMSCFGPSGFKNVKTLQARLAVAPPQPKEQGDETAEGGEAADAEQHKAPRRRQAPKVLLHYRFDSVQGADAHLTQLAALKLYREYPDSAFAVWARSGTPDVAALLGGAAGVTQAAAAAVAAGGGAGTLVAEVGAAAAPTQQGVSVERAKEVLAQVLAARKQLEADLAARRAKAEEEGLELEEEEEGAEYDLRLARGLWRVRVLGVSAGGSGAEDMALTISNLLAYDGELDAAGGRTAHAAKVAYPNHDTYFGPYAAGAKGGIGLYVAANGACYVGQYAEGKRGGYGLLGLPDGGRYKGGFKEDKFEGQGTYQYPDGSLHTGSWKAGQKHGQGTYWDKAGGCLRGTWAAGQLRGDAQYDQPSYHFEGRFAKGLPSGPCSFALSSEFRTAGLPAAAVSYVVAPHGPTLQGGGNYELPPGAHVGDADGEEAAEPADAAEDEGSQLPAWPKYEGLAYKSAVRPPCSVADVPFPPPAAPVATI